ncbi:MAG: DNA-3-methyladenine glycosylase I [Candidatus Methanoplasma sp.]|nr:DNA-3-methyladenine glycosylase I [Candidatus Methanoplasma sp.]
MKDELMTNESVRCDWADRSPLERIYHDTKWGIPVHDDKELFKMLMLESMQAGLSWSTILAKMDTLCAAFDDFDPSLVSRYDDAKIEILMKDDGIIKNRAKINAAVHNARMYHALCEEHGSLDSFLWKYVDFAPIINRWEHITQVPPSTALSDVISKDLKKLGFKFVGSTTIYAFMQSVGMVNDHLVSCSYRHTISH